MKEKIAERIRIKRHSRNLSQQNMADELNITVAAYSNIERGVTDITVTRLFQIATILEVSPLSFLQEESARTTVSEPGEMYQTAVSQQLFLILQQMHQYQKQLESLQAEIEGLKNPKKASAPGRKKTTRVTKK